MITDALKQNQIARLILEGFIKVKRSNEVKNRCIHASLGLTTQNDQDPKVQFKSQRLTVIKML